MVKTEWPTASTKEVERPANEGPKAEPVKNEKKKLAKPKSSVEWGKPVALFNTRIPEQMSELLDDLIYKLRTKGDPKTKQELAHEALKDLLRKHSIC